MTHETSLILEAFNIQKSFYHPAFVNILQGINLKVSRGESVAIIGRSGEGKSTLLQILGTLEQPCKGLLKINNEAVSHANLNTIRNEWVGFIFQSFHLLEDYTALENVLMPARIARRKTGKGSEAEQQGMELLEKVGLADRARFHTKLLSGGEKQRVALARAMCNDPKIIFADEPSGNLDRQTAYLIHDILLKFAHERQKTLILVTHDKELAKLCSTQYELISGILHLV
ncbi:MAG: ABC transporter ATP-binding protein [Candidatus Protochlamydia sp.]|nr:ABC transporter ATP-binding protein [Candidatus Protochlamydia sp.]